MDMIAADTIANRALNLLRVFVGLTLIVAAAVAGGGFVAEMILLSGGAVLLFAELAVLPGFGIAGVSALLMLGGGAAIYLRHPAPPAALEALTGAAFALAGAAVLVRTIPRLRFFRDILPGVAGDLTTRAVVQPGDAPPIGALGLVVKPLRPVGVARFAGREWEVTSERDFLEIGEAVHVERCDGGRIVVRPALIHGHSRQTRIT